MIHVYKNSYNKMMWYDAYRVDSNTAAKGKWNIVYKNKGIANVYSFTARYPTAVQILYSYKVIHMYVRRCLSVCVCVRARACVCVRARVCVCI